MHPECFESDGFIVSAVWLQPEHTMLFEDEPTNPRVRKFKGILTSLGGELSHAVVVARGMDIPCVIAPAEYVDRIRPGDRIEITPDGVVHVNGGDPNFTKEEVSLVSASYRFVFSKGEGKLAKIDATHINRPGTMHPDLLMELMTEGYFSFDDPNSATLGYINDDGSVDQDNKEIPDQNAFEAWIDHIRRERDLPSGTLRRVDVSRI